MGKAGYGLLAVSAIAGLLALVQWQQGEIDTLARRVDALESELSELASLTEGLQPGITGPTLAPAARRPAAPAPGVAAAPNPPPGPAATSPASQALAAPPGQPYHADDEAMQAVVAALESDRPEIQEKVRAVVRAQQEALWDERRERRQAMWEERQGERLQTLAAEAHLDQGQVDALFGILTASRDRVSEVFREARRTQTFENVHQKAAAIREQADGEARELLDEDQYEAYKTMREQDRERRRRDHRPPPPPAEPGAE